MNNDISREEAVQQLAALIEDIEIAMLTTVDEGGALRSRPMATQKTKFDGDLWFFTAANSPKVAEVFHDREVNVSYARPDKQRYVSVSGVAQLVRDRALIEQLWSPVYKAWFPDGLDDPNLALLRVRVDKAEFWETPSGMVVHLAGLAKALATGQTYESGDHAKLSL